MKKTKFSHRVLAIFLTLTFLPSVMPMNFLYASNNGPNAPEAASFEPVDATDMVNLVTGDMSYVLPLLNVPSPEGGYPLALSYHAGIAMDQEASWVGLGWSLNPGAINRGVNGYPDDWGKTSVNEFFYDQGFDEDFYSFSAGVQVSNAVTVGLGASWGSNQALGGFVQASFGVGGQDSGASINGRIGTNGSSIGAGFGGFNASFGTNGAGIGYGLGFKNGSSNIGLGLNYNTNSGLSGGISVSSNHRTFNSKSGFSGDLIKSSSMGVSLSSKGISSGGSLNGIGAGISTSSTSGPGQYDVVTSTTNFNLPIYIFYLGYQHVNRSYSLFENSDLYTSGMLNPVEANELKSYDDNSGLSRSMKENHLMDVNVISKYDTEKDLNELTKISNQRDQNNLVLPSYDNYMVSAQGLSGNIKPYIHSEINLSGRGVKNNNDNSTYLQYLNHDISEYNSAVSSGINVNRDATKKVNFTFQGAYNSFLRLETSNINNPNYADENIGDNTVLDGFDTQETNTYSNSNSLTNEVEAKKREGNFIQTFTNQEIRNGNVSGFVEANTIDRQDEKVFINEGIGAYQITTVDGRTYHYSLPVYNFESFYRNFKDADSNIPDKDKNFFEIKKTTPYATHWLLTGVTGPDYVDNNTNGKLDEADFGYWVEFDYGKWTDGYIWQTPNEGRYDENTDEEGNVTYSYARGRKQMYYLDAIKTRTHTALFVKDLRDDAKSTNNPDVYNQKWTSGEFDPVLNAESIIREKRFWWTWNWTDFGSPIVDFYDKQGNKLKLPIEPNSGCDIDPGGDGLVNKLSGRETVLSYLDAPKNIGLRLSKIILLKNSDVSIDKGRGAITTELNGVSYENTAYLYNSSHFEDDSSACGYPDYFINEHNLIQFKSHQHENVLDVQDIDGLNLENQAQQVIDLDYDYSLAQGSPNSDALGNGRLSLKRVDFKGKQGIQLIPPYKFSYANFSTSYNYNNEDAWGHNKVYPAAWSLNEIETPTGGKIKIEYESDSYYAQAATHENKYFENSTISANLGAPGSPMYEITISDLSTTSDYFKVDRECLISFERQRTGYPLEKVFNAPMLVTAVSNNKITVTPTDDADFIPILSADQITNFKVKNNIHPLYTDTSSNGKQGGGIRVKTLNVTGENTDLTTEYVYTNPETGDISGITSYAPVKNESQGIPYASELPAPTVMYGHVKMINKDSNGKVLGSSKYEFETLKPFENESSKWVFSLGEAFKVDNFQQNYRYNSDKVVANKSTIYNKLANVGRLLSVSSQNSSGEILNRTINNYKTDLDGDGEIGVDQESHKSVKRVLTKPGFGPYIETFHVSSTSKVSYPSVLQSTTNHQGNFSTTTSYDKYDFLTGQVLESTTTNSEGREFKTEVTPAYTHYDAMAGKVDNASNKNMLVQNAMNKTYMKEGSSWETISANISTWTPETYTTTELVGNPPNQVSLQTDHDVWRKHKSYIWDGDTDTNGFFENFSEIDEDDGFDWTKVNNVPGTDWSSDYNNINTNWKLISEITKYDKYSMPLETVDINGNKASTKMGDRDSKIIAVGNAGYNEMHYSGAEYNTSNKFDGGNIDFLGQSEDRAHTGKYSIKIASEQGFKTTLSGHRAGKYKISVWASKDNYSNARINDGSGVKSFNGEEIIAGDWVMLNHYVDFTTASKIIYVTSNSGTTYFDDFRVHPVESSMTTYVYNEWDELSHVLGGNNLATFYEYDEAGRLMRTSSELVNDGLFKGGFKKGVEYRYNYKGIGLIDENGNGSQDANEGLDPLGNTKTASNGYSATGTLTIVPTGGSGQFTFRYASGLITTATEAAALQFGIPTSNNQFFVNTVPCSGGSYGYNAFAVRIEIRDTVTGDIKTDIAYYNKECASGGGGEPQQ